jgi:RNA polymerase sigma-B factor
MATLGATVITFGLGIRTHDTVTVIDLNGELNAATASPLAALLDAIPTGTGVVVNLAGITLIDAAAITTLIGTMRARQGRGGQLCAVAARGVVLEAIQAAGVAKILGAHLDLAGGCAEAAGAGSTILPDDRPPDDRPPDHARGELSTSALSEVVHGLLAAAADLPADHPARQELRDRAVTRALPYARRLAARYRHRGEPVEDLHQVAALGLVKAVNGYQPDRGATFIGYATPTILGELRRYFRDSGWTMGVSRRVQELRLEVNRATEKLSQMLGHQPAASELAEFLNVPVEKVRQCLVAAANYRAISFSTPVGTEETAELAEAVGAEDPAMDLVEYRQSVGPLLAKLSDHEREVIALRFFAEMTQSQIAKAVGTSQMHVSRLLAVVLGQLRGALVEQAG